MKFRFCCKMRWITIMGIAFSFLTVATLALRKDDKYGLICGLRNGNQNLRGKNKELGEVIESMNEVLEGWNDEVIQMSTQINKIDLELNEAKEAILQIMERRYDPSMYKVMYVGALDINKFSDAYAEMQRRPWQEYPRYTYNAKLSFDRNLVEEYIKINMMIKEPEWNPWVHGEHLQIDDDDPKLLELCETFGEDICYQIEDVMIELAEYNGNGRNCVPVPWNYVDPKHRGRRGIPRPFLKDVKSAGGYKLIDDGYGLIVNYIGKCMIAMDDILRSCYCHAEVVHLHDCEEAIEQIVDIDEVAIQ